MSDHYKNNKEHQSRSFGDNNRAIQKYTEIFCNQRKKLAYLKFAALDFNFQSGPTIYANLPLAAFAFQVRSKHGRFLTSALSQVFRIDVTMVPLILVRTTTQH